MGRNLNNGRASRKRHAGGIPATGLAAEVDRLQRELAEARARLDAVVKQGAEAFAVRRMSELEEARQVARGQALEAAAARSRAEAELRALRDAIGKAPGWRGMLLRWAAKDALR